MKDFELRYVGSHVFLFCSGAFPVNTVSHNSDTIKRTFKGFCGLFA